MRCATVFFLLILLFPGIVKNADSQENIIVPSTRVVAPQFTLVSLSGKKEGLETTRGKLVVMNFWATWCAPCRMEMPALETLSKKFKDQGLVVLGISQDRGRSDIVQKFIEEFGLTFTILLDPEGTVRAKYEVDGLPTTYIIGRDGKFLGKVVGFDAWDSPTMLTYFQKLLNR
ncbi:MAG: TlpA disulfide reductase family protein [Nitrospinota bacterium]